ncbi:hypothetical protein K488DRAFT_84967 [Vararia minispora EC-137]|uniref:Uncharacterized protein n=1 Tax=Vararia minispora EC-137 TaxID=1314806 RepID=A0ACB8QP43_9AGAM|nr:hypothetical protein K488DRAFT_84967 [Vararia minispora EC-137]
MPEPQNDSSPTVVRDDAVIVEAAQKLTIADEISDGSALTDPPCTPRPIVIYTRPQILALYHSPLVKPLDAMPPIKDWFGDWPEQSGKSYSETSTLSSAPRDRRFRREQDDNDPPPRATFRSTLSQPSQMGNFKHQSSRTTDRDRDRDLDKERERDIRDREGQERLRNLSDKYDRDRLGASAANGLRGKDRDSAPHLSVGSSRLPSSGSLGSTSRRGDGREGTRRKGENADDWRRGRDDRGDDNRRDRGDRERPRSRNRDSSRSRRDPSIPRRDRDRDREDRDRDDGRRRDRDRDRDGDKDRDDNEDPRRWRDDGKREERIAARRERDRDRDGDRDRARDRPSRNGHDSPWDIERPRDRDRWNTDERDGRSKRANGRDRRGADDDKDKDDRRDRDREREKEKEPAWMETYIPTTPSGGILGARPEGGMDSIQAWKRGMKEKEEKEKAEAEQASEASRPKDEGIRPSTDIQAGSPLAAEGLDEIQLFKMMMKREQEKAASDAPGNSSGALAPETPGPDAGSPPGFHDAQVSSSISIESLMSGAAPTVLSSLPPIEPPPIPQAPAAGSADSSTISPEAAQPIGSRFFPNPTPADPSVNAIKSPAPAQYTPPPGPRLLALGSRTSSATSRAPPVEHTSTFGPTLSQLSDAHMSPSIFSPDVSHIDPQEQMLLPRSTPGIAIRAQPSYPSFENQLRPPINLEEGIYNAEVNRRQILLNERAQFGLQEAAPFDFGGQHILSHPNFRPPSQSPSIDGSLPERSQGGSPYQSKGSRFAKFFDGKGRDIPPIGKASGPLGYASPSPHLVQRPDFGGDLYGGGPVGSGADQRTMEDIFAMLQNSAQNQRVTGINAPTSQLGGPAFGQNLQPLHMHQHERNIPPRNLDMLYDNRVDDRNFMPDGMVPGLRSAPPPRARDSGPLYRDQIDDMAFSVQPRMPQQRGVDPMFGGPPPQAFTNQGRAIPVQQPYRNGVSPVQPQNPLHGLAQQRVPPGLANLGGRPPHEPSQFLNSGIGLGVGGMQTGSGQPQYNNFPGAAGGLGYGGGPQLRAPPPGPQLSAGLGPSTMAGLVHNKVDMRAVNQAQILGLGTTGGGTGGGIIRVPSGGYPPQQPGPPAQIQHAQQQLMRQQALQQQQLQQQQQQSRMQSRMLPPHMQGGGLNGQPAQDLMALLMHGTPRE